MTSTTAVVRNERGIHLRPSGLIAAAIRSYSGTVRISTAGGAASNISSPLEILSLALKPASVVHIEVSGPDEQQFSSQIAELFSRHYDFT